MIDKESLIKKIRKAFEQEVFQFGSEFSDEEMYYLFNDAKHLLNKVKNGEYSKIPLPCQREVFIVLAWLTRKWNYEERGWLPFLSRWFFGDDDSINGKVYFELCKCIDSLSERDIILSFPSSKKKYYSTICCYSFSPKESIEAFLDLCWSIYANDFQEDYTGNKEMIPDIVSILKDRFKNQKNENDDITIGSGIYAIRVGLKALMIDQEQASCRLLERIFEKIDKAYYYKNYSTTSYFDELFLNWWDNKKDAFWKEKISQRTLSVAKDYSSIRPRYMYKDSQVSLIIPSIRMNNYSDNNPWLEVFANGDLVIDRSMRTSGSGLMMLTKEIMIDISNYSFADNIDIRIVISHNGKTIYDSSNRLKRSFLLFDDCGREMNGPSLKPGNYFLYAIHIDDMNIPFDCQNIISHLYSLIAHQGEMIQKRNDFVYFEDKADGSKTFVLVNKEKNIIYLENGENFDVLSASISLLLSSKDMANDIQIKIDDNQYHLNYFAYVQQGDFCSYDITNIIEKGKPFSMMVFSSSKNKIIHQVKGIFFNQVIVKYDKTIYFADAIPEKITVNLDGKLFIREFQSFVEEYAIPYRKGDFVVNPPFIRWKMDDGEFVTETKTYFYRDALTNGSKMKIDVPYSSPYHVGINNQLLAEKNGCFNVGEVIESLLSHSEQKLISVILRYQKQFYELARIYLKPCMESNAFLVDSDKGLVVFDPTRFHVGEKGKVIARFYNERQSLVQENDIDISSSQPISVDCSKLEYGYYQMKILKEESGLFRKETLLHECRICLGNEKSFRFMNKHLKIDNILPISSRGRASYPKPIHPFYIDSLRYVKTIDGEDIYLGRLYLKKRLEPDRKIYLDAMYDEDGFKINVNPLIIRFISDKECYLGYDFDLSDPECNEYEEFSISSDYRVVVGETRNHLNIEVDYYYYKVEDDKNV